MAEMFFVIAFVCLCFVSIAFMAFRHVSDVKHGRNPGRDEDQLREYKDYCETRKWWQL